MTTELQVRASLVPITEQLDAGRRVVVLGKMAEAISTREELGARIDRLSAELAELRRQRRTQDAEAVRLADAIKSGLLTELVQVALMTDGVLVWERRCDNGDATAKRPVRDEEESDAVKRAVAESRGQTELRFSSVPFPAPAAEEPPDAPPEDPAPVDDIAASNEAVAALKAELKAGMEAESPGGRQLSLAAAGPGPVGPWGSGAAPARPLRRRGAGSLRIVGNAAAGGAQPSPA